MRFVSPLLPGVFALVLLLSLQNAVAKHQVCTWDLGTHDPGPLGWHDFCEAHSIDNHDGTYTYRCDERPRVGHGRQVATWNRIGKRTIEMDKGCYRGFGEHASHAMSGMCYCWRSFAVCPWPVTTFTTCRGWSGKDDCEWPIQTPPPDYLSIYALDHFHEKGLRRCGPTVERSQIDGRDGVNASALIGDNDELHEWDEGDEWDEREEADDWSEWSARNMTTERGVVVNKET